MEGGAAPAPRRNKALKWRGVEDLPGTVSLKAGEGGGAALMSARISRQPADDLLMMDRPGRQLRLLYQPPAPKDGQARAVARGAVELDAGSAPAAMLPMRLNVMGQASLGMMSSGRVAPTAIMAAPMATFVVSSNTDSTAAGSGSLRRAIIDANANAGADMITFTANAPVLTITGTDNAAMMGDLDINDSVTILGNGSGTTIINTTYVSGCGDCKVFGVNQDGTHSGMTVSFVDVTVQNGFNPAPTGFFQETGGGIDFFLTGTGNAYSMTNCVVTSNEARGQSMSYGGGINIDSGDPNAGSNHGTVSFTGTTFSNNACDATGGGLNLFPDIPHLPFPNLRIAGNRA